MSKESVQKARQTMQNDLERHILKEYVLRKGKTEELATQEFHRLNRGGCPSCDLSFILRDENKVNFLATLSKDSSKRQVFVETVAKAYVDAPSKYIIDRIAVNTIIASIEGEGPNLYRRDRNKVIFKRMLSEQLGVINEHDHPFFHDRGRLSTIIDTIADDKHKDAFYASLSTNEIAAYNTCEKLVQKIIEKALLCSTADAVICAANVAIAKKTPTKHKHLSQKDMLYKAIMAEGNPFTGHITDYRPKGSTQRDFAATIARAMPQHIRTPKEIITDLALLKKALKASGKGADIKKVITTIFGSVTPEIDNKYEVDSKKRKDAEQLSDVPNHPDLSAGGSAFVDMVNESRVLTTIQLKSL